MQETIIDVPLTTEHCLKQFGALIGDDVEQKRLFASLNNVELQTIERWLKGDQFPSGLNEIRLRFALEHAGYKLIELNLLPRNIYIFAKHIAYGLCPIKEAEQLLNVNRQAILRIISGRGNTTDEKLEYITLYNELHEQQLIDYELTIPALKAPVPSFNNVNKNDGPVADKKFIIDMFINLVTAIAPLAKLLASDEINPEDREEVRERAGRYTIFNFKNDLVRLCGERARSAMVMEDK